jgi:thermolabile hemolysin
MNRPCLFSTFFAALLGLAGSARGQTAEPTHAYDEPRPQERRQISSEGPEAPAARRDAPHARGMTGRDYTYMRCWYRKDANSLKPGSDYAWARGTNGDYYRLRGHWYDNFLFLWRNMFYTDTPRAELEKICRETLREQGKPDTWFDLHAADNGLSFNYLVWTQNKPDGGSRIDRMVSFGDSLSDTMNLHNATLWAVPHRESWLLGRFSNGPLWNEQVAAALGLPLYNWAVAGAAGDQHIVIPGVGEQVDSWEQYMRAARDYQPARTLFTLWIGGNDLINYGRSPDSVAQHVETALRELIAQGARYVLVMNLPDLTLAPSVRGSGKQAKLAADIAAYNQKLHAAIERLREQHGDVHLLLMDNAPLLEEVLVDPARHGLRNVSEPCLQIDRSGTLKYAGKYQPRATCTHADDFFFWDDLHPTTKGHGILAEKVTSFLLGKFPDELSAVTQSDVSDKDAKRP